MGNAAASAADSKSANKKALIIGGGIAGLCTGVYLRRLGFETEILEMHTISGGLATAWKKGGYTFENCLHWLVGSKDGSPMNAAWKEIFDIGRLKFYDDPVFQVIERGKDRLSIYRDPGRLEAELMAKAPEDAEAVRELVGLIRKFARMKMPESDSFLKNIGVYIGMVPFLPALSKYGKLSMADYGKRLKNPLLKAFFTSGISELSFLAIVFSLAWMAQGNASYAIGGSMPMIRLIEKNYRALGGKIRFKAKVERIMVEGGRAVGVALEGGKGKRGEEARADIVVSAADGHATIFDMLGGKYVDERIKKIYETYKPFPSYVQVSLGVDSPMKGEPGTLALLLDKKVKVDPGTAEDALTFRVFNFDPTFAPAKKTAVVAFLPTYNHEYWRGLREKSAKKYEAEKKRVAAQVIAVFEKRFPKAKGKIKVVDVATPATIIRYTGNWRGSMEGWLMTPATGIKQLPAVLPGLKDFYMVGQWISPGGGLPAGLLTGRGIAKMIAKDSGRRWKLI